MSIGFAMGRRASAGTARAAPGHRRSDVSPVRLTVSRVKYASIFFVGALMFGVVSNAMLFQTGHRPAPLLSASNDARSPQATPVPRVAERPEETRTAAVPAVQETIVVDPTPVGSIAPAPLGRPKPRQKPRIAKAAAHPVDAITAFLRKPSGSTAR